MKLLLNIFSSLRLTVALLALSIALIFFGTLDQVHIGIRGAQMKYFESLLALWQYPEQWWFGQQLHWLRLPVAGGYLLGPLLVINLTVAHFRYFRPSWKKAGIAAIHAGIVLLLISELLTHLLQEDSRMWIDEGGKSNYTESFYDDELVIIDKSDPDTDTVVSIPTQLFEKPNSFQHAKLPFRVEVIGYYPNAEIFRRSDMPNLPALPVDRGLGREMDLAVRQVKPTYKQNERNATTAVVTLHGPDETIGTWLVSNLFGENLPPQTFSYDGRLFEIALRFKRNYLPYQVELLDFTHERYPGTEIPKDFSSRVHIVNPETGEDRTTLIYMNHPLRYEGLTFYQASFAKGDTASMFQVVRNPGWLIPYISCLLVSLGLLFQFGYHLVTFAKRRAA